MSASQAAPKPISILSLGVKHLSSPPNTDGPRALTVFRWRECRGIISIVILQELLEETRKIKNGADGQEDGAGGQEGPEEPLLL